MNAKKVLLFTFVLVALLTISSPSLKASAEVNSLSKGLTTLDSPKFGGECAVGLPYEATSDVGKSKTFDYDLEKDREYVVFVYGPFLGTSTDYDLEVYEPGKSEASITSTRAAGILEKITFQADEDGEYKVKVRNDEDDSGGAEDAYIFLAETIKLGNSADVLIEHRETIHTYYAFWFDASGHTADTISLELDVAEDVDMYQMRLYPFVEEGGDENIYDILAATSENALLTDDASEAGQNLEISFSPTQYSSPENIYIISLIGEKGDGNCKFKISGESEQQANETTTEEPTVRPLCLGTLTVSAFTVISLIAIGIKRRKYREET
ncbi:MAG: hypothetical protein ACFFCD_00995 [Promethearchaeota archaeon]